MCYFLASSAVVKFLRLALFCDNARTGETLHSTELLFELE